MPLVYSRVSTCIHPQGKLTANQLGPPIWYRAWNWPIMWLHVLGVKRSMVKVTESKVSQSLGLQWLLPKVMLPNF